jgi:hypothetical protein
MPVPPASDCILHLAHLLSHLAASDPDFGVVGHLAPRTWAHELDLHAVPQLPDSRNWGYRILAAQACLPYGSFVPGEWPRAKLATVPTAPGFISFLREREIGKSA